MLFIIGFIYDKLQDYTLAFLLAGAPPIIGACILFFVRLEKPDDDTPLDDVSVVEDTTEQSRTLLTNSETDDSLEYSPYARRKITVLESGANALPAKGEEETLPRPILSGKNGDLPRNVSSPALLPSERSGLNGLPGMNGKMPRLGRRVTYGEVVFHGEIENLRPLPNPTRLLVSEKVSVV